MLGLYRKGAEKRGLTFDLTLEDVGHLWQTPCHYCGEKVRTLGLDRVDNAGGYTRENVVSCCSVCNFMKLTSAQADFIAKCKQIASRFPDTLQ